MKKEIEVLTERMAELLEQNGSVLLAIDGRCGSGKTTLGRELQKIWQASLFHMDDFYLQKEQRTKERYEQAGGNVDYERFTKEVLLPLKKKQEVFYRPYDPPSWSFRETVCMPFRPVNIVEGSYSCRRDLQKFYDLKIFLDIDPGLQMERIKKRNGEEKACEFQQKWIPLEEMYFETFQVAKSCDFYFRSK